MTPKADGAPVFYKLWASLRLGNLRGWVEGLLPKSTFCLSNGFSSVEVWFSSTLDVEEVVSEICGDQLHVMVADVILTLMIGRFLIVFVVRSGHRTGLGKRTLLIIVKCVSGLRCLGERCRQGGYFCMKFIVTLCVP